MAMPSIRVYHTPFTCSGVVLNALEELGLKYEDTAIDIFTGQQRGTEYLAINRKGKVPALRLNDKIFTELPAILWMLNNRYGRLFGDIEASDALADLIWFADTLHGSLRMAFMPQRFTTSDTQGVCRSAGERLAPVMSAIAQRVATGPYWFDADWTIVDVYAVWLFGLADRVGIERAGWPDLSGYIDRVMSRPSFQHARAREEQALALSGIILPGS